MNIKRVKMRRFLLATIFIVATTGTYAGENKWRIDAAASFKFGTDNSSYLGSKGLNYQDRTAYRFGFNRTLMDDLNRLDESGGSNFLGGSYRLTSGRNSGQLDLSLDTHFLNQFNEDSNGIQVFSPQLAYLSFDRKLYVDLGYAYSHYEDGNSTVHQLTPTFGFTLNHRDWFQVRGYFIDPGDAGYESRSLYTAAETSWVHRFNTNNILGLSQFKARALLGRRLHSVDQELKTVNYFQDEQGGSLSFSIHWSLPYNWGLMFQNSIEEYYRGDTSNPYRLNYGFFGIERRW